MKIVYLVLFLHLCINLKAEIISDSSLWLYSKTHQECSELNQSESNLLSRNFNTVKCQINLNSNTHPVDWLESQFFQNVAENEVDKLKCQFSQVANNFNNSDFKIKFANQLSRVVPELSIVNKKIKALELELIRFEPIYNNKKRSCLSILDRKSDFDICMKSISSEELKIQQLRKDIYSHQAYIQGLKSQIWNSDTEVMSSFIDKNINNDSLTVEEITKQIPQLFTELKTEFKKNELDIKKQASFKKNEVVYDNLNISTKRKLVENWLDSQESEKIKIENSNMHSKFVCHLEGKYTKGQDFLYTSVGLSTFVLGGFSLKFLSKIPSVVYSSLYGRLGEVSQFAKNAKNFSIIGIDTSLAINKLYDVCIASAPKLMNKNKCVDLNPDFSNQFNSEIQSNSCMVDFLEQAAPVGLASTVKAVQKTREKLKVKNKFKLEPSSQISKIEDVIGRPISSEQAQIINEAHLIGRGEMGLDGSPAQVGNYTQQQKFRKIKKLRELKNTSDGQWLNDPKVRRLLFENNIVGDSKVDVELFSLSDEISQYRKSAKLSDQQHSALEELDHELAMVLDLEDESVKAQKLKVIQEKMQKIKNEPIVNRVNSSKQNESLTYDQLKKLNPHTDELVFYMPDTSGKPLKINFSKSTIKDLQKIDQLTVNQFLNSMTNARTANGFDQKKIKYLFGSEKGSQGKPIEIRRTGHGHSRIIGCEKDGELFLLVFERDSKNSNEFTKRYKDICL